MATSVARSASPPAGRCNPSWIASTPFALSGDTFQTPTYIPAPRSPGRPGRTSARHADCLPLWGWSDDLQAELGRIGIALIPRDDEVLEARRLEDDQDPRRLTLDGESVGEIPRQGRVRAGLDVDALVAVDLQLRARAAAVLDDPSALRPGQHRFFYCHRWSLLSRWVQVSYSYGELGRTSPVPLASSAMIEVTILHRAAVHHRWVRLKRVASAHAWAPSSLPVTTTPATLLYSGYWPCSLRSS